MNRSSGHPRVNPFVKYVAIAALCGLAGAIIGGVSNVVGDSLPARVVVGLVFAVLLVISLAVCLRWWAGLDEAAQEAHKWAWWWGGSAGMALGLLVLLAIRRFGGAGTLPTALTGQEPEDLIYLGAMGMLLFQMVGYIIAWAAWWLRRR